jgi:hypothetical protein
VGVEVSLYSFFNFGVGWEREVNDMPRPLYPQERPSTHCTRGWVGSKVGLDGYEKSRSHWDSIPGASSP